MSSHPFQVGDKVALAFNPGRLSVVPQLVPGRVYCVGEVSVDESDWQDTRERVCLVGIREDRRGVHRQADDSLPAYYFRLVSTARARQQEKGDA